MKKTVSSILAASILALGISSASAASNDLGRQTLPQNDGWASYGEGTTGGADAANSQIFTVSNKQELVKALGAGGKNTPKIIYVDGAIDFNVDENNQPIGPEYYADEEYDFNAYLAAYNPETWGLDREVSGPLEEVRARAQKKQKAEVVVNIGSNTSIIGLGSDAKIIGGSFIMSGVENIIIRNIEFEAPRDFFPQWDPTDGSYGEWNSEYDNVTITNGSHHVWLDHNTFSDGEHHDGDSGKIFGRTYQQHDGLLDVTNASDYVTISYNVFHDHDKVSLIGSSDSRTSDRDHLKVTLHHNYYKNLTQRLPRVRYGQVHIYNNYYEFSKESGYKFDYALGVGIESKIYAENNFFQFDYDIDPGKIIKDWKGTTIYEDGSYVGGKSSARQVDLVDAFNHSHDLQLSENVGWKPSLVTNIHPTQAVPAIVKAKAGAGNAR
ncbi:pectate lyase family protein [Mesobacillus foraminis]|uniref:Pectate lyase n=1 Tax=Mesobacillus foraminis TaxID=279826 RepID=A0A4R2B4X2_9BACI|nr:pectate lyase [Mesobacillus foraminis]TCN21466.1 pectate lyase [Mesobacillus foraminis]